MAGTNVKRIILAVSNHDIAFAIMQGAIGLKAPPGTVPEEALAEAAATEPDMVAGFYRAAKKVAELFARELINARH